MSRSKAFFKFLVICLGLAFLITSIINVIISPWKATILFSSPESSITLKAGERIEHIEIVDWQTPYLVVKKGKLVDVVTYSRYMTTIKSDNKRISSIKGEDGLFYNLAGDLSSGNVMIFKDEVRFNASASSKGAEVYFYGTGWDYGIQLLGVYLIFFTAFFGYSPLKKAFVELKKFGQV